MAAYSHHQKGFTLIELSIVLVIIGLIVGGVLVGQNLIHAAQIRATLTQMSKLNTAVNTFRDKFGGMPGDLENYASVGMYDPVWRQYVGNGTIDDTTGQAILLCGEVGVFFADLSLAGLLENNNMVPIPSNGIAFGGGTPSTPVMATLILPAAIGNQNYIWVSVGATPFGFSPALDRGQNYYYLAGVTGFSGASCGAAIYSLALTTTDAASIDSKLDDGNPFTGLVKAVNAFSNGFYINPGANQCMTAGGVYDVAANPTAYECQLVIRTGF